MMPWKIKLKARDVGAKSSGKPAKPRGKQQYRCKECKKKFITELNYTKEFKQKAIKMLYEGASGRAVGRIMGINKSTVYN